MKCTEATVESVQGKTEVRILQPHYYYFVVLGCDSAVLGLSACHFSPDSDPTVSNSDVLLPVSLLTHSLFHARTSAIMSGRQTRSKTKYDQPAAAAPKTASTSKRKPDSSGKGDKPAKKNKMQERFLLRWSRRLSQRKRQEHQPARWLPWPQNFALRRKTLPQRRGKTVRGLSFRLEHADSLECMQ